MSVCEAPRLFSIDIHRYSCEHHPYRDTTYYEEAVAHSLHGNPVIAVERQSKCKHVLDEVHDGKRLRSLLSMAVNNVSDDSGCAELNSKIDQAHAYYDRYRPWLLLGEALTPREEAGCCEEQIRSHDGQSKLGL